MATRDYKARERSRPRRGRRGGSGFFWFLTGAVCGAFAVGLAWTLQEQTAPPRAQNPQVQAQPATKPSFVYHQLLPEMEVVVPNEELTASAAPPPKPQKKKEPSTPETAASKQTAEAKQPEQSSAAGTSYLVQVASFRQASDAERLKAKLALLGVQSRIQRVTVNGKAYHRVRAGPYNGKQQLNETRALLSSNGLEGIAIKLK